MFYKRTNRIAVLGFLVGIMLILLMLISVMAQTSSENILFLPLILNQYPPEPSGTTQLLITEVLYNAASEPAGEWIEIFNPGSGAAILSAYKLGDEEKLGYEEGMLQFPPETMLEPRGVIVVANRAETFRSVYGISPDFEMQDSDPTIPDMLPYFAWSTGTKVELVNSGDELLLLDGDDIIVDALSWGSSTWESAFDPPPPSTGDGESLERSPAYLDTDTAADWIAREIPGPYQLDLRIPTPTVSPTPIIPTGPTTLLVSEVLYDPSGEDPAGEWIEIYNAGENNALLSDFRLGDEETQFGGEGMYFFPNGVVLFIDQVAVIARDAQTFEKLYGFKPDFEISDSDPTVPKMIKDTEWGSGSLNLSSSGDEILLVNNQDFLIDGVSWGSSTEILDPSAPKVDPDHSIERYPPDEDQDIAANWRDQPNPIPGQVDLNTPTATATSTATATATSTPTSTATPTATSTPTPLPALIINEIHAEPHDINGDANGDGIVDNYDDEFIEIVNTTTNTVAIGGWEIHDNTGLRHVFTDTLVIPSGCGIVLFGGGIPTGSFGNAIVETSSTGALGLNNSGDTLTLFDLSMTLVDTYSYGSAADDDQSITRDPDIIGPDPMVKHSEATGSNGVLFSPGTRIDGATFAGCSSMNLLKQIHRVWKK